MFSEIAFLRSLIVSCSMTYVAASIHNGSFETLYNGAQVWQTILRSPADLEKIQKLEESGDISVWNIKSYAVDFLVKHEHITRVLETFKSTDLKREILIRDVQGKVNNAKTEDLWNEKSLRNGHRLSWNRYPTLEVINEYLGSLVESYPSICTTEQLGKSVENRPIMMLRVSNGNPNNEGIVVLSGVHAREWAAMTSLLFVLNNVVSKFDKQPGYMMNKDWYFIPVLNPDGFVYSYTRDRLWRKNRRVSTPACTGVDLNRNFELDWDLKFREKNECGTSYAGRSRFSEPESAAFRNWILKNGNTRRLKAFVDIHTYGQQIMYPWSARDVSTPDRKLHSVVAKGMAKAIRAITDQTYSYGDTFNLVYPATGTIMDWIYSSGVRHSYGIEARDHGRHGFLLPTSQIESVGTDVLAAVRHLARALTTALPSRRMDNTSQLLMDLSAEWF